MKPQQRTSADACGLLKIQMQKEPFALQAFLSRDLDSPLLSNALDSPEKNRIHQKLQCLLQLHLFFALF